LQERFDLAFVDRVAVVHLLKQREISKAADGYLIAIRFIGYL
jgi:hypothetical protein